MIEFRAEETVNRPADEVWAYAADILEHPRWMAVSNPRLVSGSGTVPGSRGREVLHLGPFRYDTEFEVTIAEPGRRLAWRALSGLPFAFDLQLELQPLAGGATRAAYVGRIELRGAWRLLHPFVVAEARGGPAREMRHLKEAVEALPRLSTATA